MVSLIITKLQSLPPGHPPLSREDRVLRLEVAVWVLEGEKFQNLLL